MPDKIIKVTCQGADSLPISALTAFQGNLKTLHEKEYNKLKNSIQRHGFAFPVFIWKNGGENFIIDGHQRVFVANKMIEEGWEIENGNVPVDWIEAETLKGAKEKVLLSASQYGKIDIDGLYEFIETSELNYIELQEFVDLVNTKIDYVMGPPNFKEGEEKEQGRLDEKASIKCPECGYEWKP